MGFSVVEFLIYFALLVVLGVGLFQVSARVQSSLLLQSMQLQSFMQLCNAHDILARDLYAAPSNTLAWPTCNAHELVWQKKEESIGWVIADGALYRLQGQYDTAAKTWRAYSKSLVAQPCDAHFIVRYAHDDPARVNMVFVLLRACTDNIEQKIERLIFLHEKRMVKV